jgi:hypothetical protein
LRASAGAELAMGLGAGAATLPAAVAAARLRGVAQRPEAALADTRASPWAMRPEELMG